MDNNKIGKLICELRKKKGLTQEQLGEMVGVGFRAVSKWERGITLPDIGIVNEVSKILGISSDELLSGELKITKEPVKKAKKKSKKIIITISIVTIILIAITSLYKYQNDKVYTYSLMTDMKEDYHASGQIKFEKDTIVVNIDQIRFKDEEIKNNIVKNYEYQVYTGNEFIFGYNYSNNLKLLDKEETIEKILKSNKINFNMKIEISREKILRKGLNLKLNFIDNQNNLIVKELKIELKKLNKNN